MGQELSKTYEPQRTEKQVNALWESGNCFHARADGEQPKEQTYTIVIPPPNVTAPLHLGHALNNTLQDILIRFRRMQRFNTLWMPGTDHAGIATQTVVEKRILAQEGKRRTDFERSEFVSRVQAWKDEYEGRIIGQLQAMGCSCDWQRTRFTMDEVCARAVRAAFFRLFDDGLIYRGKRLVNWDPATQTVLADDEVEHETIRGHFWYMRYPLIEPVEAGGQRIEYVTVATTRPETMLGDTAVAMNPGDERAKVLVGKKVRLPVVGRIIPIIADEHVVLPDAQSDDEKAQFSTGFLKVTPAHDPDDWEIGRRHSLPVINVMAPDGTISDRHGWTDADSPEAQQLLGMDRFEAREAIVEWFRQEGLLESVAEYTHEVGHSYRSHVPIEPYLSDQWYIAVKKPIEHLAEKFGEGLIEGTDVPVNSLAGLALKPLLDGRLRFIPDRYAKTYQMWLENLRDWPISRQLWWGHRIPVWTIQFNPTYWANICGQGEAQHVKAIKQEFSKLSNLCSVNDDVFWRETHEDRYRFYVCSRANRADVMLDFLSKRTSRNRAPTDTDQTKESSITFDEERNLEITEFRKEYGEEAYRQIERLHRSLIISCERDPDVLDTWFSSALWPFSTLGWPEDTPEMRTFYPGDVLCTAREIITLWVSRMVMMGQYCVGDIPFRDVFIHAMIQDGEGRKMSKSLGNGIDPLVAIGSHGADAMRLTLASMTTDTQDIRMPVVQMQLPDGRTENTSPKFDMGRNFCNKLWNAARFSLMNLKGTRPEQFDKEKLDITDRWVLSRLGRTADEVTDALENYRFNEAVAAAYRFFWNDFCDWYLEWAKPRLRDETCKGTARNVLAFVLDATLRLLHPFIPFITEGIFQKLREVVAIRKLDGLAETDQAETLASARWPKNLAKFKDDAAEEDISTIQTVIRLVRDIRNQYKVKPSVKVDCSVRAPQAAAEVLKANAELVTQLARIKTFETSTDIEKPAESATAIAEDIQVFVHEVVDTQAEKRRLEKQRRQLTAQVERLQGQLANENFINKAKSEVVQQARDKLAELQRQLESVEEHVAELK